MAKIYVTGGQSAEIERDQADYLKTIRWGDDMGNGKRNPSTPIEIPGIGFMELKEIKRIDFSSDTIDFEERAAKHQAVMERCLKRREQVRNWQPLEKAERMLRTYTYLLYRARRNQGKIIDPLYSQAIHPILEFFENNQNEYHCTMEHYQSVIPTKPNKFSTQSGFKHFSQLTN